MPGSVQGDFPLRPDPHTSPGCLSSFRLACHIMLAVLSGSAPFRLAAALSASRQTSYRPFRFAAAFQACYSFSFSGSYHFFNRSFRFHFFTGERVSTVLNDWVTRQSSPRGTQVPGSVQGDFPCRPDPYTSPGLLTRSFIFLFFFICLIFFV